MPIWIALWPTVFVWTYPCWSFQITECIVLESINNHHVACGNCGLSHCLMHHPFGRTEDIASIINDSVFLWAIIGASRLVAMQIAIKPMLITISRSIFFHLKTICHQCFRYWAEYLIFEYLFYVFLMTNSIRATRRIIGMPHISLSGYVIISLFHCSRC